MTYSLINKSCLSCTSCGRSTHRHGRTAWVCRRFGFDIDASTVPGETISCDRFDPRVGPILTGWMDDSRSCATCKNALTPVGHKYGVMWPCSLLNKAFIGSTGCGEIHCKHFDPLGKTVLTDKAEMPSYLL